MKPRFKEFIKVNEITVSDINFTNLFAYNYLRDYQISNLNGNLVIMSSNKGKREFLAPIGSNQLKDTVTKCLDYLKELGHEPKMTRVCEQKKQELEGKGFLLEEDADNSDYVYRIGDLADMPGSEYSERRNQVNHIMKKYYVVYRPLSVGLVNYCKKFQKNWYKRRVREDYWNATLENEHKATLRVLDNYHKLDLVGGLLFLDGVVRGFIISDVMSSNTMTGHFIKGARHIRGVYATLLWMLARQIRDNMSDIKYLNAEQDLGLEGLRQSKKHMGFHFKVRKYDLTPK